MKKLIFFLCFLQLLISCKTGESKSDTVIPAGFNSEVIVNKILNTEELISKTELSAIVQTDTSKIITTVEDFGENKSLNNLLYSWPTGQTFSPSTESGSLKIPEYASVGFGQIFISSREAFKLRFGPQSKEMVEAQIRQIAADTSLAADAAIWEAKDIAANAKIRNVEELTAVGNAAYWETPKNVLHVLVNDVCFSIAANVGKEEQKNKEIALKTLQVILKK